MKPGKLYKIERLDPRAPSDGLEWVFVWDNPYGGNRVIDKLPVGKPYMFIRHEPGMSVWCNVLYRDRTGWLYLREHSITELTDKRNQPLADCPLSLLTRASGDIV